MPDPSSKSGGVALSHPEPDLHPFRVAPAVDAKFNVIRAFLIPVGCWRVDDVRFEFGSSFPTPDLKDEMGMLDDLRKAHPGAPLSLFGHADPIGDDTYNKDLSGRRASAIYGLLIRDTAIWEDLYSHPTGDNWGTKSIQIMLRECGETVTVTGSSSSETTAAIKSFQGKNGLGQSGTADSGTRAKLFKAYMDRLCVTTAGAPYQLTKADFLAKGADSKGKGDYQGCGEFNPFMVFSSAEDKAFAASSDKTKRNEENSVNRRVMALLFRPGSVVDPGKWPCPTVKDGTSGCKARFWSDGEKRRTPAGDRRTFDNTHDTFACRFYHRLVASSPCEGGSVNEACKVTEIKATLPSTKSVRDPSRTNPARTLTPSTSQDEALATNVPVILVQGCNDVDLEAVTSTSTCEITWTVKPNENSNPACTIVPNGRKAQLKADQQGSFSVIATAPGGSKIVWNVVFVAVIVHTDTATVNVTSAGYVDNASTAAAVRFSSGVFLPTPGTIAWSATITKVELIGGSNTKELGIDQVEVRYLQSGIADTLSALYSGGGAARENTKPPKPGAPRLPVVDSNANDAVPPYADLNTPSIQPNQQAKIRSWFGHDSPGGGFRSTHPKNGSRANKITGINGFRAAVASFSLQAPDAIVVHAENRWSAHFDGDVKTTGAATYTANGATTTDDSTGFTLINAATNGQDAGVAGYETFTPIFRDVEIIFED
ncbi:MAG: peptidoglycan-binding protein [Acidobacteria bacterium]|nr:peptidoglycan-binding protein [Acidobacteriota bacterium]